MKWFRFYTEIIDDPKMRKLTGEEFRLFTYLLAIAAEEEKGGLIPYGEEDIAWKLRAPQELVTQTIEKCIELRILEKNGTGWRFINWDKRQFRSDNVTGRVRKLRKRGNETLPETQLYQRRTEQSRTEQKETLSSPAEPERCPHEAIVSLYHETLPELPRVKVWTEERRKQLRARWHEEPKRQDLEWWRKYFEYVRKSSFLMGGGANRWVPDLEWLVKKSHLVRVIEGKYHEG